MIDSNKYYVLYKEGTGVSAGPADMEKRLQRAGRPLTGQAEAEIQKHRASEE